MWKTSVLLGLCLMLSTCSLGINFDAIEACPEGAVVDAGTCICPGDSSFNEALGVCECPIDGQELIAGVCACAEPLIPNDTADACLCPIRLEGAGGVFNPDPQGQPRSCSVALRRLDGSIGKTSREVLDIDMLEHNDGTVSVAQLEVESGQLVFVTLSTLIPGDAGYTLAADDIEVQVPIPSLRHIYFYTSVLSGLELVELPEIGVVPIVAFSNGLLGWVNTGSGTPTFEMLDAADFSVSDFENRGQEDRLWSYAARIELGGGLGQLGFGFGLSSVSAWQDDALSRAILLAQGLWVAPQDCDGAPDICEPAGWSCQTLSQDNGGFDACLYTPAGATCDAVQCPLGSFCSESLLDSGEARCVMFPAWLTAAVELEVDTSGGSPALRARYRLFDTSLDPTINGTFATPNQFSLMNFASVDRILDSTSNFIAAGTTLFGLQTLPPGDSRCTERGNCDTTCTDPRGCSRFAEIAPSLYELTLDPLSLTISSRRGELPNALLTFEEDIRNQLTVDYGADVVAEAAVGLANTGAVAEGKDVWTSSVVMLGTCTNVDPATGIATPATCANAESSDQTIIPTEVLSLISQWERSSSGFTHVDSRPLETSIVRGVPVDPEAIGRPKGEDVLFVMASSPSSAQSTGVALLNPTAESGVLFEYPLEFVPDNPVMASVGSLFAVATFREGVVVFELSSADTP